MAVTYKGPTQYEPHYQRLIALNETQNKKKVLRQIICKAVSPGWCFKK